jgi:hypothetical protein
MGRSGNVTLPDRKNGSAAKPVHDEAMLVTLPDRR